MTGMRTCSIHIDAPPSAAFALMRDPGCYDEFMPGVRFTPGTITQDGVGTTFDFETRVAGVPFHGSGTFTQFEVDRHIRSDSPVPIEGDFEMWFAAEGDGVRVTIEHHPGRGWGVPLLGRFLADSYAKDDQRWLDLLKRRLEGPTAASETVPTLAGLDKLIWEGLLGRAYTWIAPRSHAGVYQDVAEMLDLQPDDDVLDIGCGPGAFLATHARGARTVTGLDASRTMIGAAQSRLADRIASGTARVLLGDSARLPFDDQGFSAVTVITAPLNLAEVFRVLRPGGRLVVVDELAADPRKAPPDRTAGSLWPYDEAATRQVIQDAGFVDLNVRYRGVWHLVDNRITGCRRPPEPRG
jgi:SAM-dependent methyltransferase